LGHVISTNLYRAISNVMDVLGHLSMENEARRGNKYHLHESEAQMQQNVPNNELRHVSDIKLKC